MKKSLLFVVAVGILMAVPLAAHHSLSAEFDTTKPITFTGTVKKVDWMNPHIYTHVVVTQSDGKTIEYRVEGGPPNSLFRNGWRADSLKPGQTVTVSGLKAKSETSTNVGQATISSADGKRYFAGNNQ